MAADGGSRTNSSMKPLFIIIVSLIFSICSGQIIPKKKYCADNDCTETISMVRAMNRFPGGDHPSQLSFNKGQIINVKAKAVDENIWEGETSHGRGYFPMNFVKEFKVYHDSPRFIIDSENPFEQIGRDAPRDKVSDERRKAREGETRREQDTKVEAAVTPPKIVESEKKDESVGGGVDKPEVPEAVSAGEEERDETELEDDDEEEEEEEEGKDLNQYLKNKMSHDKSGGSKSKIEADGVVPQPVREEDETEIEEDETEEYEKILKEEEERKKREEQEKKKAEEDKKEKEKQEKERLEKERKEKERKEQLRLDEERIEKEWREKEEARKEKERLEAERKEKERLEQEKREKEKLEAERKEKERLEAERKEKERLEAEKKERLEAERKEKERLEAERKEKERLERERKEKERLEAERKERERIEAEKKKAEEIQKEKEKQEAEKKRIEEENKAKEKTEKAAGEDVGVEEKAEVAADLDNWARDESQPVMDGFSSFLTGGKLGNKPDEEKDKVEDDNKAKVVDLESSRSSEMPNVADKHTTVVEAGTTLVINEDGNLVTTMSTPATESVQPTRVDVSAPPTQANTTNSVLPDSAAPSLDGAPDNQYQNLEFNSRKVLSVNKHGAHINQKASTPEPSQVSNDPWAGQNEQIPDPATKSYYQYPTTPQPPQSESSDSGDAYKTDPINSRKINDEKLQEEEETAGPGVGKKVMSGLDQQLEVFISVLPQPAHDFFHSQPLGLTPQMAMLVVMASFLMLLSLTLSSCGGGNTSQKLRAPLEVIGELEAKLQLVQKEKEGLEDQVADAVEERDNKRVEAKEKKEEAEKLKKDFDKMKDEKEDLEETVSDLKSEVGELKKSANLKQGESSKQNKKTKDLEKQITKLQEREKKLEEQKDKLSSDLKEKDSKVTSLTSQVSSMENQVGHLETRKQQLLSEAEDWQEKVSEVQERLDSRESEFKEMKEALTFKESELDVLKDCFLQLKAFQEKEGENDETAIQDKLKAMTDVSTVNASLGKMEDEKKALNLQLQMELEQRTQLEAKLAETRREAESSISDKMKAERQCQEAQTKLSVLSSYFKEKETQLQKELGEQEALKRQNLTKLSTVDETTQALKQEVEVLRAQTDSLKRELSASERDFRAQIAANEKKAHENWLAARAAERELKEARHEGGVLRQKMADIERRGGPGGIIRPLPTRGMPPPGMLNGPPPPGDRRTPPHLRDDDFHGSPRGPPLPPFDRRGPPILPPGMRPPGPPDGHIPPYADRRATPSRLPPYAEAGSPPPRMEGRSPPPFERRPHTHAPGDRGPYRLPPSDMPMRGPPPPHSHGGPLPPHGGPLPPHGGPLPPHVARGNIPRNSPGVGEGSPRKTNHTSPRQPQSQV